MFQFRRFPAYAYLIQRTLTEYCSAGFPHSEIHGSMRMCRSPWLIAACRVLLRLLMPRHSPCALFSLTLNDHFCCSHFYQLNYAGSNKSSSSRNCNRYPSFRSSTIIVSAVCSRYFRTGNEPLCCLACLSSPLFSFQGAKKEVTRQNKGGCQCSDIVYPLN